MDAFFCVTDTLRFVCHMSLIARTLITRTKLSDLKNVFESYSLLAIHLTLKPLN